MAIGSITIGTRKCVLVGGANSSKTRIQLKFRVDKKYRVQLLMDGMPFGGYQWTVNKRTKVTKGTKTKEEIDTEVYIDVPSDGRNHQLALKDVNSNERSSDTQLLSIGCAGGVITEVKTLVEDPATGEKRYTISLRHAGRPATTLTGVVLLNGKQVGGEIPLKPRQQADREVTIPADSGTHVITTAYRYGKTWVWRTLWFAIEANDPPLVEPGTWTPVTQFKAGETVVATSAVGETPLATDGSEWVLLEYSPAGANSWVAFAEEGGLVEPDTDGTWRYEITTGAGTPFTSGTSWDVRARRFLNYRESQMVIHTFTISADPHTPPSGPLTTPRITGPVNKTAASGTRVWLSGSGPAGARLEFRRRLLTSWGEPGPIPAACTVGEDGKWQTWVIAEKKGVHSYKRVAYSCRAKLNGRTTGWSNELTIRWNKRK